MRILAIESTCDETAAAVVENCGNGVKVLSSVVASSMEMHEKYGGIVPEIAAREQVKSVIPVIKEALSQYKNEIEAVAVSYGPGLMGSLLIGVETAKTLAWSWEKELIKVNHMKGHIMANWIVENSEEEIPVLPALGVIISGGHTDLVWMKDMKNWKWIGGTRDDAAGEAFDKVSRLLGLPYPGGPELEKAAQEVSDEEYGKLSKKERLPRPLISEKNLDMSFSGLKAAVARKVENIEKHDRNKINLLARDFSEAVTEILTSKIMLAMESYRPKSVILAGGVAANLRIRAGLQTIVDSVDGAKLFVPKLKYCGDNAAMIGAAGILVEEVTDMELTPDPGLATV